jgi:hypothetical protein
MHRHIVAKAQERRHRHAPNGVALRADVLPSELSHRSCCRLSQLRDIHRIAAGAELGLSMIRRRLRNVGREVGLQAP